ncbi:MAG: hypothetical protein CMQ11_17470 [Gammaproteobacteria bacterium]|nr:hypothetical protein [Erythrobacter sp.]MAQ11585.1 hypothetical protein [Gammaproteobacteria bacterium]
MLEKWTKWASLGKAAETPEKAAEASTKNPDQKDPTARVTEKVAPHQTSANISPEPKPKPAERTESSTGSSEPVESRSSAEVKFFLADKNYGFLLNPNGGKDILIHRSEVVDGTVPQKGAVYWFNIGMDRQQRPCAVNASLKVGAEAAPVPVVDYDTKELFDWAFIPLFSRDSTSKAISELASLALTEDWRYRESPTEDFDEFGILRNYIKFTFTRLRHEGKVITGDQFATFNTGLVDRFYEPIHAFFEKNDRPSPPWKWRSFCVSGQGEEGKLLARTLQPLPEAASYFKNIDDLYFDAEAPFDEDLDHIVLDGIKRNRYPHDFLDTYAGGFSLQDYVSNRDAYLASIAERLNNDDAMYRRLRNRLKDAILLARKRVSWNYRAVVPQYYPKHNLMSFLLPISLMDDTKVDAALVVQSNRVDGKLRYQGYTIYPLAYAYRNARLVAKPISDWLDPERILGA